jgi:hypothetical protein
MRFDVQVLMKRSGIFTGVPFVNAGSLNKLADGENVAIVGYVNLLKFDFAVLDPEVGDVGGDAA